MPQARTAAERALVLHPDHEQALHTLAEVALQYDRDHVGSAALWDRALEHNPRFVQARAERALWFMFARVFTMEHATAELQRCTIDEPLNAWCAGVYCIALGFQGRHTESIAQAERAVALDPESFSAHWAMLQTHAWAGQYERAVELSGAAIANNRHPWALGTLGWTYAQMGRLKQACAVYDELAARSRHEYVTPAWLAVTAAAADRLDDALRFTQQAVDERDPGLLMSSLLPQFDRVRAAPWYEQTVRGIWG